MGSAGPSAMALHICAPDETRHSFVVREEEPLDALSDAFFSRCRSAGLPWSSRKYCLTFDGDLIDCKRSARDYELEDGDLLDLVVFPPWHWKAHAPSAAPPCPGVVAPLLEMLGGWEASGKLAQLNRSWLALVDAWRMGEGRIELTHADPAALAVIASRCTQLRHLTIHGSSCRQVTDEALSSLVVACPQLQAVELESCSELTPAVLRCIANNCPILEQLKWTQSLRAESATAPMDDARVLAERDALVALGSGCRNLRSLALHRCVAPTEGLQALFNGCGKLQQLELPDCHFLRDDSVATLVDRRAEGVHCCMVWWCRDQTTTDSALVRDL